MEGGVLAWQFRSYSFPVGSHFSVESTKCFEFVPRPQTAACVGILLAVAHALRTILLWRILVVAVDLGTSAFLVTSSSVG